jgi:glycosyltransferase involved in cell wall biosynthesis
MSAAPRVSVIVAARNAVDTLGECFASLVAQTLDDFEVIVVDDGSTDGTGALVLRAAAGAPMPIHLVPQPHAGRAAARNTGLSEARGEFVGFVDADDTAEPEMLELMVDRAERTGADLVVCEYVSFDAESGATLFRYPEGDASVYGASVTERPALLLAAGASVCNKLVRRSLFTTSGIRFPDGMDFEDLATAYRLAAEANRIEKVERVLYRYRRGHGSSVMTACDERYLQIPRALEITNRHFAERGIFEQVRPELEAVNFTHLIRGRFDDLFRRGTPHVRHEFIRVAFALMDTTFPSWRSSGLVRDLSGRRSRHVVSTHRWLLTAYTDLTARAPS